MTRRRQGGGAAPAPPGYLQGKESSCAPSGERRGPALQHVGADGTAFGEAEARGVGEPVETERAKRGAAIGAKREAGGEQHEFVDQGAFQQAGGKLAAAFAEDTGQPLGGERPERRARIECSFRAERNREKSRA